MAVTPLQLIGTKPNLGGSRDMKLGIIAVKVSCWAPDLESACLAPAPDISISGLVEWQPRTFNRIDAGEQAGYDVEVTLEGHVKPDTADEEYYELEGSTSDDPIESHWNLDVLLALYAGTFNKQSQRVQWAKNLTGQDGNIAPGNSTAARNPMFGAETWLVPGLIWSHNWVTARLPDKIINELGTITGKLPGKPKTLHNPPGVNGSRNWLCVRVRGRERGNIWQMSTSYQLSGPYGWVEEMYRYL